MEKGGVPMTSRLHEEAILLLARYLTIDTRIPPGDMTGAIDFFCGICEREKINFEVSQSEPGRLNFIARLEGTGEKKPIALINHMDVVPVERNWSFDPFGGVIEGGYLYGRGALDMKCVAIFQILALLELKRRGIKPNRDFLFIATCDEETGGHLGTQWLVDNLKELQNVEAVLNEGWPIVENPLRTLDHIRIDTSEKRLFQVRLRTRGSAGHASIPLDDNPNNRLVDALHRVIHWQPPVMVTPVVERFFKTLALSAPPELANYYADIRSSLNDPGFSAGFMRVPTNRPLVMNTLSLTTLESGGKVNVIPPHAEAYLDMRLLPGVDRDEVVRQLREVINDPEVSVEIFLESANAPESSTDTETWRVVEEALNRQFPGVPVTPNLFIMATDSRFFREKGINAYGFLPIRITPEEHRRIHGADERISLENIKLGTDIYQDIVKTLAGVSSAVSSR